MIEKGMEATSFVQTFANQFEREFGGKATTATNTLTAAWDTLWERTGTIQKPRSVGREVGLPVADLDRYSYHVSGNAAQNPRNPAGSAGRPGPSPPTRSRWGTHPRSAAEGNSDLRDFITGAERGMTALESQRFGRGYFAGLPTAEEIADARTKLLALQKTQEEVIKRQQDALAAETEQPLAVPGARQRYALRKIEDDLQKQLRDIDLTAGFVTPLELAEQRLKAIEESFKRMREVVPQIGEGLRQTLVPTGKTTPFYQMIEASAARYRTRPQCHPRPDRAGLPV